MSRRSRRHSSKQSNIERLVAAEVARQPPAQGFGNVVDPKILAAMAKAGRNDTSYGPSEPLMPQSAVTIKAGPRAFAYPIAYNTYPSPRSTEGTSFETLRRLAMCYDGIQLCEQAWLDIVAKLSLAIKPRDEIIAEQGKSVSSTKYADRIRRYSDFFAMPDTGNGYDLKSWLRAAVRDQLQIDAVAIYVRRNRGGGVYSLELVDGASVKPLLDPRGRRPAPPLAAYQQYLYGVPAGWYTSEELLYQRETTRTDSIYGLSRVERIILRVNQALRKQNKDLSRFTEGNVPPGLLEPPDDGSHWTPDQLLIYQEMWDALLAGNDQARSRVKVIQPGSKYTAIGEEDVYVDFDRFLLNVAVACYGMTMADLGFTENVNKSSGESQQNVFYRRAVQPLMDRYAQLFTFILRHYFGEEDLVVSWSGFEESEDFNTLSSSYVALTNAGIVSPTTAAHKLNLPWSGPDVPNYIMTSQGPVFLEDLADPQLRKASKDAKLQGYEAAQNMTKLASEQAPDGNEAQRPGEEATPESEENEEDSDDQRLQRAIATDNNGLRHTGMMIAFMLKEDIASQLALPGGVPAQDLHCTLCYLGDLKDEPRKLHPVINGDLLRAILARYAQEAQPLSGSIGGLARFAPSPDGDGTTPVVALVNTPGLQEFRRELARRLEDAGFSVASDFDFTPHITLAYIDPRAPMPLDAVPSLPLAFDALCLAIGSERSYFPIGNAPAERSENPDFFARAAESGGHPVKRSFPWRRS